MSPAPSSSVQRKFIPLTLVLQPLPDATTEKPLRDYASWAPSLDALCSEAEVRRRNVAVDQYPHGPVVLPEDPAGTPAELAQLCLQLLSLQVASTDARTQKDWGVIALADLANQVIRHLRWHAWRGDEEAVRQLNRIGITAGGGLRDLACEQPELMRRVMRKEPIIAFGVSRDRAVIGITENLMRQVELGEDFFVRFTPAGRRRGRHTHRHGAKRGPYAGSAVRELMNGMISHLEPLRSGEIRLKPETVPASLRRLMELPSLTAATAEQWSEGICDWVRDLNGGTFRDHDLLERLGGSQIPQEISRPTVSRRRGRGVTNHRTENGEHEEAYLRRGIKKRIREWMRDNLS